MSPLAIALALSMAQPATPTPAADSPSPFESPPTSAAPAPQPTAGGATETATPPQPEPSQTNTVEQRPGEALVIAPPRLPVPRRRDRRDRAGGRAAQTKEPHDGSAALGVGVALFAASAVTRALAVRYDIIAIRKASGQSCDDSEGCSWYDVAYRYEDQMLGFAALSSLLGVGALASLGVGAGMRGRFLFASAPRLTRPQIQRRLALGWGLFAAGVSTYFITRIPINVNGNPGQNALARDLGFGAGMLLATPGILMGAHATGYRIGQRKRAQVSLSPAMAPGYAGVSIRGSF